jgi:hypothetical protein
MWIASQETSDTSGQNDELARCLMTLHAAITAGHGRRAAPYVPAHSPAGLDLLSNERLSTLCSSIERLSLATTDTLRGLAVNCQRPTIAVVAVARMLMDCSARLAHLGDPAVETIVRVCRAFNENLEELNQWDKHIKHLDLVGMDSAALAKDQRDQEHKRRKYNDWASKLSIPIMPGGYLNERRVGAQRAIQFAWRATNADTEESRVTRQHPTPVCGGTTTHHRPVIFCQTA